MKRKVNFIAESDSKSFSICLFLDVDKISRFLSPVLDLASLLDYCNDCKFYGTDSPLSVYQYRKLSDFHSLVYIINRNMSVNYEIL